MKRVVVKVGGAQLEDARCRAELARSVARAVETGHEIVLVHGGGNQIRALVRRLGIEERYHEGLRVTDPDTADVVTMVLAGTVNKELVRALESEGVRAAGLCGADGSSFAAKPVDAAIDLGYAGEVVAVDRGLVETLLAGGYLPVIATVAPRARDASGPDAKLYNVNADMAAGPLARALEADALLFLTDVPGVLDERRERMSELTPERARAMRASGAVSGGMIPKVEMALAALDALPGGVVKIAPAAGEDAVLAALSPTIGTRFTRTESRR